MVRSTPTPRYLKIQYGTGADGNVGCSQKQALHRGAPFWQRGRPPWRDTTSGNIAIWEMNGTTVLNPNTAGIGNVPTTWSIVGTGDFNGDGKSDVLWHDTSGNIAIWEMNGTTVLNPNTAGVGNVTTSFKIAGSGDFNGDGKSDVLWRDTSSGNVAI
jgi:hypothetical protein